MFNTFRMSNIQCTEDCVFAFLKEENYKKLVMPIDKERIVEVINFVRPFKLFNDHEVEKLYNLNYYFRKIKVERD